MQKHPGPVVQTLQRNLEMRLISAESAYPADKAEAVRNELNEILADLRAFPPQQPDTSELVEAARVWERHYRNGYNMAEPDSEKALAEAVCALARQPHKESA